VQGTGHFWFIQSFTPLPSGRPFRNGALHAGCVLHKACDQDPVRSECATADRVVSSLEKPGDDARVSDDEVLIA